MILYSRNECPLCEDIEETLLRLKLDIEVVDIDLDENLRKKYHVKVPVLVNDKHEELFFPFDEDEILEFVGQ